MSGTDNTERKAHPLMDVFVSIVVPSIILMKFSSPEDLGAAGALITALSFPIGWGLYELLRNKRKNFIALLGLISVFLTGGIGLFELDTHWLAVKEAAVPGIIGLAVLASTFTRYPLVQTVLFNRSIIDVDKIQHALELRGKTAEFNRKLQRANYFLAGTFAFSSAMNYILAKWLVTSPAGTPAFNEELGEMTLLSYPMIAIPSMIMMLGIMTFLWRTVKGMTGATLEEVIPSLREDDDDKAAS